jgi:DNA-binding GntR family transcriptional regulator
LTEARFAKAFDVSRNTVREALALLTRDGIATQNAHRGVSVSVMTVGDVGEIFQVRRLCELPAIDAAATASEQSLQRLGATVGVLQSLPLDADWREIVEADLNFHRTLVEMMDNSRLCRIFEGMLAELRLCILIANIDDHQNPHSLAQQHGDMFSLIESRRTAQCKKVLEGHLADAETSLVALFAVNSQS